MIFVLNWMFTLLGAKQHENTRRRFWCQQHLQVYKGELGISSKTAQSVKCAIRLHSLFTFDLPRWNPKTVKTLGCSFQMMICLRRLKFWLLSCLQNQKGFWPRSFLWLRILLLLYPSLCRGTIWEVMLRKKWLWPFQIVFQSFGASANIYLQDFLLLHSVSCAQNGH